MKISAVLFASALAATACFAQSTSPAADAIDSAHPVQKPLSTGDSNVEVHIKDLHTKLQITSSEEAQWDAVAKTMRDNAISVDAAIAKRQAIGNSATALEDLNAYAEVAQSHAAGVKQLAVVFAPLYAAMSVSQKKVADEVFIPKGRGTPKAHASAN
jgi:ABC-type glycerol-3-phosphate transport system substrate-binding protein